MKTAIVRREDRNGVVVRILSCGHEQEEQSGGATSEALTALCRQCGPMTAPAPKARPRPTPPPVDTRPEMQRLALEVSDVWHPPADRAWGQADLRITKLVKAAASHTCPKPIDVDDVLDALEGLVLAEHLYEEEAGMELDDDVAAAVRHAEAVLKKHGRRA